MTWLAPITVAVVALLALATGWYCGRIAAYTRQATEHQALFFEAARQLQGDSRTPEVVWRFIRLIAPGVATSDFSRYMFRGARTGALLRAIENPIEPAKTLMDAASAMPDDLRRVFDDSIRHFVLASTYRFGFFGALLRRSVLYDVYRSAESAEVILSSYRPANYDGDLVAA